MSPRKVRNWMFRQYARAVRPMTLGVRGLVLDNENQVLLIRHTYIPGWYLPGGGVEKNEPIETSLQRELVEEAGVLPIERPTLIGAYSNHANFPNDHVLMFLVKSWRQVEPTSRGEIAEVGFFSMGALPEDITQGTKRRLIEYFDNKEKSHFW